MEEEERTLGTAQTRKQTTKDDHCELGFFSCAVILLFRACYTLESTF
jgi:hypothetical protein